MPTPDDLNEDWIKAGSWDMPETWGQFQALLLTGDPEADRQQILYMQTLVSWQAAPKAIQEGAAALLSSNG